MSRRATHIIGLALLAPLACAGPTSSLPGSVAIDQAPRVRADTTDRDPAPGRPAPVATPSGRLGVDRAVENVRDAVGASPQPGGAPAVALAQSLSPTQLRALLGDAAPVTEPSNDHDGLPSPAWYWGGAIAAGAGIVGAVVAASVGFKYTRDVQDGYSEGITRDELDDYSRRGQAANTVAGTSAAIGLVGLVVAAATYGMHYTRCSKLAAKRRDCAVNR
ncbi:MAG: hypothetical protein B7733_15475 [Myxococcales bacterium FL481]|nr:MAG: hypothetical protein B7733_15475 [Myxococcales bacterium FL481]